MTILDGSAFKEQLKQAAWPADVLFTSPLDPGDVNWGYIKVCYNEISMSIPFNPVLEGGLSTIINKVKAIRYMVLPPGVAP